MPDEQANNEQGSAEALPSLEYILKNWITTKQAGEKTGLSPITVRHYCRQGRFRATEITGTWLIDPEHKSLTEFRKTRRGNQGRSKKE